MLRLLQSDEGTISVLIVSQIPGDHDELRRMLCGSPWRLFSASDSRSALRQLRRKRGIALVLCDREFWKDLLSSVSEMREGFPMLPTIRQSSAHWVTAPFTSYWPATVSGRKTLRFGGYRKDLQ